MPQDKSPDETAQAIEEAHRQDDEIEAAMLEEAHRMPQDKSGSPPRPWSTNERTNA